MYKDGIDFLNELYFISGDNRYSYWHVDDNFLNELDCIGDNNKYSYWHVDDNSELDDDCNREHTKNKCDSHDCDKCHRYHCKKACATGPIGPIGPAGPNVGATGISYTPGVTGDWYWDLSPELPTTVQEAIDQLAHQLYVIRSVITPVALGTAGNYIILAKTGIFNIPISGIAGNIGVSPIADTSITGFSLLMDVSGAFSTSSQVIGNVYAANYAPPTPSELNTATFDMSTAYLDAAVRIPNYTNLYVGDIGGQTLIPGVYNWSTSVTINLDVTLNGGATDVWIFQTSVGINQRTSTNIILTGGAQAKNIFWQSAGPVVIGVAAHFEGVILGNTNITMGTGASINGRLLAQSAVTLDANTVVIL